MLLDDSCDKGVGPTPGQIRMLIDLGENPRDYAKKASFIIRNEIGFLRRRRKVREQGRHWKTEREKKIEELGLKPGMRIRWLSEDRVREDTIERITNNCYVACKGVKTPIRPSHVLEIIERSGR